MDRLVVLNDVAKCKCEFTNESNWVLMDALPKLELIVPVSNGYERIDLAKAIQRCIRITNTPDQTTGDVANLAITLM